MGFDWRFWLLNRVVISAALILLVVTGWNIYRAANDDGRLVGRVVGPDGAPAAGATVVLLEQAITTLVETDRTSTDATGAFRFDNHGQYTMVLAAEKPDVGASPRRRVDLYFRNQNRVLERPLRLEPAEN